MSRHEIRSYDYVNHAYARVREVLVADPVGIFRDATRSAAARAHSVASELRVTIAGVDVAADIAVSVGDITEDPDGLFGLPVTMMSVSWEAAHLRRLFPLMTAQLKVSPLTPTETELDFVGQYQPPLGVIGEAVDSLVGHLIAKASVHRFVADIGRHLRGRLSES